MILFQSTHSLRSATGLCLLGRRRMGISIHALLAECDQQKEQERYESREFQSTHSLRSATPPSSFRVTISVISIHALLAECDQFASGQSGVCFISIHALLAECDSGIHDIRTRCHHFNPRTPCGVRRWKLHGNLLRGAFQSTHSLRSATGLLGAFAI